MKIMKIIFVLMAIVLSSTLIAVYGLIETPAVNTSGLTTNSPTPTSQCPSEAVAATNKPETTPDTGPMTFGKFPGKVVFDAERDLYFLELRGARLPFKSSPRQAINVELDAPGKTVKEKNRALLYGLLGPGTKHITLLVNPDEEEDVMPAVKDLSKYIRMVNPKKFNGIAYTKSGGKLNNSVIVGSQVQSLDNDSSRATPIIRIKGPRSGAEHTRVAVLDDGRFSVEGETYEDLYKAADVVCITVIKMLCGSPDCPDAAACATGGDCGCG